MPILAGTPFFFVTSFYLPVNEDITREKMSTNNEVFISSVDGRMRFKAKLSSDAKGNGPSILEHWLLSQVTLTSP